MSIEWLFNKEKEELVYICDDQRHLICQPYSIENLHKMAEQLDIKRCWFHKDHYDIPKKRIDEIRKKCVKMRPRELAMIMGREIPLIYEEEGEGEFNPQ